MIGNIVLLVHTLLHRQNSPLLHRYIYIYIYIYIYKNLIVQIRSIYISSLQICFRLVQPLSNVGVFPLSTGGYSFGVPSRFPFGSLAFCNIFNWIFYNNVERKSAQQCLKILSQYQSRERHQLTSECCYGLAKSVSYACNVQKFRVLFLIQRWYRPKHGEFLTIYILICL